MWNQFCACAKGCPGLKTTDTGRKCFLEFIEESKLKNFLYFALNSTKVEFFCFVVQIEQSDSTTDVIMYPDADNTIVFSFSSNESGDDEAEVIFHALI